MNAPIRPPRTRVERLESQIAEAERLVEEFERGLSKLQNPEDQRTAEARLRRMRVALNLLRGQRGRLDAA